MKITFYSIKTKLFFLFVALICGSTVFSTTIYVNDNSTVNDVFCTVVGNDSNNGISPATPKLSLSAALAIANNGDIIYVDSGTYTGALNRSLTFNKEIQVIGASENLTIFDNAIGVQRWGSITANNVKLSKMTITRYALASDGIALTIPNGTGIELNRMIIYANVGSAGQGAVHILGAGTSVTIRNTGSPCNRVSSANYGGGYKISGSTVLFDNCSINNNVVSAILGGGIFIEGTTANVTINNSTFDNNEAAAGGAICIYNGTLTVNNTCFNGNTTNAGALNDLGGGAVLIQAMTNGSTTNVNFNNCSFTNNSTGPASSDGGAVTITNLNSPTCNVNFTTCYFENNNAADKGEDIYFENAFSPTFNVVFKNNTFKSMYSGTQVNLYNADFAASEIKFEQLAGYGANGDIVNNGSGVAVNNPEMTGAKTETSNILPVGLAVTNCIDRFDGICGTTSATFTCLTENIWNGTTWSRGTVPTVYEHVILNANYNTTIHGNINACQLTIKSGVILNIQNDSKDNVGADKLGTYVYVVNSIFNNGTINVLTNGNLVQVNHPLDLNGDPIVTPNINFTKETGNKIRWDYVYWSKPVSNAILPTFNSAFDVKYYWDPDFCINGINFSYEGWRTLSSEPAVATGFITRVKTAAGITPTNITLNYAGTSNNGNYTANVKYYDTEHNAFKNFTLLGNPYPGAIKFEDFYNENKDIIYGTVYLWSANTPYPGSGLYQQADYASFNLTGGVGVPSASTQSPNGILPNGYIASAQGFMIRPKVNGTVVFTNKQRSKDIPSNNQFYKLSEEQNNRYWLRLEDAEGKYNELLVGYITNATNGFDEAYDGPINSLATVKFYSTLENEKLIIQGKGPFVATDKVNLNYDLSNPTSMLTISLVKKEGIFNNQKIYLHDKKLGFYQDLTAANYFFYEDGTKDRFEIVYKLNQISNDDSALNSEIFATINNNDFNVKSNIPLSKIELYDINGRLIFISNVNENTLTFNTKIQATKGVYIVNITTENGIKKTIKILNQN